MPYFLPEHNALFFHVPKTGGTSIREWLYDNVPVIRANDHLSPYQVVLHKVMSPSIVLNAQRFAFVRNPWSRFVSIWEFRNRIGAERYLVADNFTDYVKWFYSHTYNERMNRDGITLSHVARLFNVEHSEYDVEHIGKIENMQEDFDEMCRLLKIPTGILPHSNPARPEGYPHYSTYYTEETRDMIGEMYADDIARFDYEFEEFES